MTVIEHMFASRARGLIENQLEARGMSKAELCRRADIPYSTFKAQLKDDKCGLKLNDVMAIARVLDFTPVAFWDEHMDQTNLRPFRAGG